MVDIGGNIGSCSFLMLAAGARRVVTFEPVAFNLYYLTRSILANPIEWKNRFTLYPIALGAEDGVHSIFMEKGNAGNSVIGKPIHANNGVTLNISVRRFDDMLWPNPLTPPPKISLLKIDAQGFEMKVFAGARRLVEARAIQCIVTEIATDWLIGQGTSPSAYCNFLWDNGFDLFHGNGKRVTQDESKNWDTRSVVTDIQGCLKSLTV